jgi:hypothetical protein
MGWLLILGLGLYLYNKNAAPVSTPALPPPVTTPGLPPPGILPGETPGFMPAGDITDFLRLRGIDPNELNRLTKEQQAQILQALAVQVNHPQLF